MSDFFRNLQVGREVALFLALLFSRLITDVERFYEVIMVLALLAGTIIGFILAMPPGPVAVQVIRGALEKKFLATLAIGAGAALTDIIYCFAMLALTSSLHGQVTTIFADFPYGFLAFQIAAIIAMIGYGIVSLRAARKRQQASVEMLSSPSKKEAIVSKISSYGPFFIGVGLAGANLANPTFLPSLAVLTGSVYEFGFVEKILLSQLLFALGFGIGTYAWLHILAKLIVHYRERMSPQLVDRIYQFAGITFIGFGTYLGYRVFFFTKWPELLRLAFTF